MADPAEILNTRFGSVFLSKSKNVKIVFSENGNGRGEEFSTYNTVLEVGTVNPVILTALTKVSDSQRNIQLKDLEWESVHVRSYNSWDDVSKAGIEIENNNPQAPAVGVLHDFKDLPMQAVTQTENSKTYQFPESPGGRMTVFCQKPVIATGGNELPRKTSFLPWLSSYNFVYEK